jgi:hypothetical protein
LRANAIQQSDWELYPDEDLDHLEIVKVLSQSGGDIDSGGNNLYRVAVMLQNAY